MSVIGQHVVELLVLTFIPAAIFAACYRPASRGVVGVVVLNVIIGLVWGYFTRHMGSCVWSLIAAGLVATTLACSFRGLSRRAALIWIGSASLAIDLGFVCWWSSIIWQINNRLAQYPVISLADRLEYERDSRTVTQPYMRGGYSWERVTDMKLSLFTTAEGTRKTEMMPLESRLDEQDFRYRNAILDSLLEAHRDVSRQFERATGFGIDRIPEIGYQEWIIDIPEPKVQSLQSGGGDVCRDLDSDNDSIPDIDYGSWHTDNVINFVNPPTLGYADWNDDERRPDLTRVVGFRPHAFGSQPNPPPTPDSNHDPWRIASVSLISLLKHRPAAVYASEHLPNMDELMHVPTRPLEEFETNAVDELRDAHKELVVMAKSNHIRMVGSIRAGVQCLKCHQVPRGTLLGAFSYRLTRLTIATPVTVDH